MSHKEIKLLFIPRIDGYVLEDSFSRIFIGTKEDLLKLKEQIEEILESGLNE